MSTIELAVSQRSKELKARKTPGPDDGRRKTPFVIETGLREKAAALLDDAASDVTLDQLKQDLIALGKLRNAARVSFCKRLALVYLKLNGRPLAEKGKHDGGTRKFIDWCAANIYAYNGKPYASRTLHNYLRVGFDEQPEKKLRKLIDQSTGINQTRTASWCSCARGCSHAQPAEAYSHQTYHGNAQGGARCSSTGQRTDARVGAIVHGSSQAFHLSGDVMTQTPSDYTAACEAMRAECVKHVEGRAEYFESLPGDLYERDARKLRDAAKGLRALPIPPQPAPASPWRDIASAPKNGTDILGLWAGSHAEQPTYEVVSWKDGAWCSGYDDNGDYLLSHAINPTYWQPLDLPPPPGTEEPGETA